MQGSAAPLQRRYRERKANGETRPHSAPVVVAELPQTEAGPVTDGTPGPVESAVKDESAAWPQRRVRAAQAALAMARILDNPKAVNQQPAAAKVLAAMLDKLRTAGAQGGRGGRLAVVRTLTAKGGA